MKWEILFQAVKTFFLALYIGLKELRRRRQGKSFLEKKNSQVQQNQKLYLSSPAEEISNSPQATGKTKNLKTPSPPPSHLSYSTTDLQSQMEVEESKTSSSSSSSESAATSTVLTVTYSSGSSSKSSKKHGIISPREDISMKMKMT